MDERKNTAQYIITQIKQKLVGVLIVLVTLILSTQSWFYGENHDATVAVFFFGFGLFLLFTDRLVFRLDN